MKDMPALLMARDAAQMERIFPGVIDTPRMLRTYVQMVRSGVTRRQSFGTVPRRAIRGWFDRRSDEAVFSASVGNQPSLADIVRMVHPKPAAPSREALYGYLLGRDVNRAALPPLVQQFEAFKAGDRTTVPDVPFQMLTALDLGPAEWREIARLALIDIQPSSTTQAVERDDVLNIGGFSDHVFELLADFAAGRMERGHWVGAIESVAL